jgi:hypothetical protein
LPPVSAQNRNTIAVQLLIVDADDDFFSPQNKVTPPALEKRWYAPQARGYAARAHV